MQIIVLGMHRSGTTLLTRMIHLLGASLGDALHFNPPTEDNPRGFFERKDVWRLSEDVLADMNRSWLDVVDLEPLAIDPNQRVLFEIRARQILAHLDPYQPWVIKDPRLCILFPLWRPLLEQPVCVFVYRDPIEIARSLAKRDGFSMLLGVALWEHYTLAALRATMGLPRLVASHQGLVNNPVDTARKLLRDLTRKGVTRLALPPRDVLLSLAEPGLYRAKSKVGEECSFLSEPQRSLAAALADGSALGWKRAPTPWPGGVDLLRGFVEQRRERIAVDARLEEYHHAATFLHRKIAEQHSEIDRLHARIAGDAARIVDLERRGAVEKAGDLAGEKGGDPSLPQGANRAS